MARIANHLKWEHLVQDALFVIASVLLALFLSKSPLLSSIVDTAGGMGYLGAFVVGIFFTSVFTIAPAIVILAKLSLIHDPVVLVILGASGAVLGDLLIFRIVQSRLRADVYSLVGKTWTRKVQHIFHKKIYRKFAPFVAALVIASPLPDELGLILVGMSDNGDDNFLFLTFVGNAVGITLICIGARMMV